MQRRSQGLKHPLPNLDAHLHKLIHTDIGVGNFPNIATPVQTPQRNLLGAAPSISESIGTGSNTIMGPTPPDDMAATLPTGGLIAPTLTNGSAVPCPAGGRPAPDINAVAPVDMVATFPAGGIDAPDDALTDDNPFFEIGTPARPAGSVGTARPTALETFAMAIKQLPDLEEPVDSFLWREAFMQQACLANKALADFHRELDGRFDTVAALCVSCADLKDLCLDLRATATATCATATATMSNLPSLIVLMGRTHERVSTLEAASAKNMADVAATMAALAGNEASHNRTAEAVAGISATVTGTVDDLVGRHIGALKSDVSSLGQDVHALCTLLATMHEKPRQPWRPWLPIAFLQPRRSWWRLLPPTGRQPSWAFCPPQSKRAQVGP